MKAKLITKTVQSLPVKDRPYDVRDTDLAGFLLRVLPSGTMSYYCDYRRPDGRRTRVKLGDASVLTPAQARDEALKVLGDRARGEDPAQARKAARQETLEEFIEKHYRPWAEGHRKTGKDSVRQALAQFAEFKGQKLSEISSWKVEKWRSARLKDGRKAATVNRNVTRLKAVLQKAVQWGVIPVNPLATVNPLRIDSAAKIRYLTPQEEADLRAALDQREERIRAERRSHNAWCAQRGLRLFPDLDVLTFADYLKPMVLLSINTGLRRGELFSLSWDDVDLQRRTLTVAGETAKSGKTRHIPLNREAFEVLSAWRSENKGNSGLVFANSAGERFNNIKKSWMAVLDAAKIEDFRWHDLRHHFASLLVVNGVDLNTVRELLGHGDLKMTLRYAHLAPQVKADAVAKLDAFRPPNLLHASGK